MSVGERIPRAAWGARPAKARTPLRAPAGVAVHYEGPPMGAYSPEQAVTLVRGIQRFHMDTRGWSDVAYTMLVDRFGRIFDGRGLGVRTAAQGTNDGNNRFYAVCALVGAGDPITDELLAGMTAAVELCRAGGAGLEVRPHGYFHATSCPGPALTGLAAALNGRWATNPAPITAAPVVKPPAPQQPARPPKPTAYPGVARRGDRGQAVVVWQTMLAANGYTDGRGTLLPIDGDFGALTEGAMKAAQGDHHLTRDGVGGKLTWAALRG